MDFTDINVCVDDVCVILRSTNYILSREPNLDDFDYDTQMNGCLYVILDSFHYELLKSPIYGKWCIEILEHCEECPMVNINFRMLVQDDNMKDKIIGIYKSCIKNEMNDYCSPVGKAIRGEKIFNILTTQRQIGLVY